MIIQLKVREFKENNQSFKVSFYKLDKTTKITKRKAVLKYNFPPYFSRKKISIS